MTAPIPFPEPGSGGPAEPAHLRTDGGEGRARPAAGRAFLVVTAAIAGSALLGVAAGFGWAAQAPRPLLEIAAPGAAGVVNPETTAFIAADAAFTLICLAGGVVSGTLGYFLAVRRNGPAGMTGVLLGAVAAAFITRWIGEQAGLAHFHHLLATLPDGAKLHGSLMLSAGSGLAFWPLAAGLVAGALTAFAPRPAD
jgi:hypothetical protein